MSDTWSDFAWQERELSVWLLSEPPIVTLSSLWVERSFPQIALRGAILLLRGALIEASVSPHLPERLCAPLLVLGWLAINTLHRRLLVHQKPQMNRQEEELSHANHDDTGV